MAEEPLIRMRDIYKKFGGVQALENVDFDLGYREIVGLVGDNGAGKSTLIEILSGIYRCDRGEIFLEGGKVDIRTPKDAKELGIETVHQDLGLVDNFNVAKNMFLGKEPTKFGLLNKRYMERESQRILGELRIEISSVRLTVRNLSGGQRKAIAVGKAVYTKPRIVIMDEPTAALAVKETEEVLRLMTRLKETGLSVVFISHVLQEIFSATDRIVVLRSGKKVGDKKTEETNMQEIIRLMVGTR